MLLLFKRSIQRAAENRKKYFIKIHYIANDTRNRFKWKQTSGLRSAKIIYLSCFSNVFRRCRIVLEVPFTKRAASRDMNFPRQQFSFLSLKRYNLSLFSMWMLTGSQDKRIPRAQNNNSKSNGISWNLISFAVMGNIFSTSVANHSQKL